MSIVNRRDFLGGFLATGTTAAASPLAVSEVQQASKPAAAPIPRDVSDRAGTATANIDFRYAPAVRQTAFCFPDDPHKSLVDHAGQLLYGYEKGASALAFHLRIGFTLGGMEPLRIVSQQLESPAVPIVRTVLEFPGAVLTLITFATNETTEGRVDNVLAGVSPRASETLNVELLANFHSLRKFDVEESGGVFSILDRTSRAVLMVGKANDGPARAHAGIFDWNGDSDWTQCLRLSHGHASQANPYRAFFRFPMEKQDNGPIRANLDDPDRCLESCRSFWKSWSAFRSPVAWIVPGRQGDFVEASARNILQAREVRDGRLTFQVGPTCYRGLWIVDGNFILEAARYLGYDKDAEEGLRTTWAGQLSNGQFVAGGGQHHWKDTAIAMFTLVRQCELSQNWTALKDLQSQVNRAIAFLRSVQADAVKEGSALGRYGLLSKGVADGGIMGPCEELTNTLWALAGLKAIAEAAERLGIGDLADAGVFYNQLHARFLQAASSEMRRHDAGFAYLPILLKNDPMWELPDVWDRPHPQSAQWALSQAIFPGCVFSPQHPIARGHARLMQAVTREDIPAETGWGRHDAVWTYNAAFVAEVYLWLGMTQAAHDTFIGFLNHASPQYCWREEQPLQNALVGTYVGDMPHNWASAECIRYVRHMLALEDGNHLRLLAGITLAELEPSKAYRLAATPTRFGRLDLQLEPLDRGRGWRFVFQRESGPPPQQVSLPHTLGGRFQFKRSEGAHVTASGDEVLVDQAAAQWTGFWEE